MPDQQKKNNEEENKVRSKDYDEEVAAEFSPTPAGIPIKTNEDEDDRDRHRGQREYNGKGLGITALVLAVLSFFMWPYLFAPAGIIIGAIAARRGSSWGIWAVVVGIIAVIIALVILPFRLIF